MQKILKLAINSNMYSEKIYNNFNCQTFLKFTFAINYIKVFLYRLDNNFTGFISL